MCKSHQPVSTEEVVGLPMPTDDARRSRNEEGFDDGLENGRKKVQPAGPPKRKYLGGGSGGACNSRQ